MAGSQTHLLLVGGGHAHVAVLADWIRHGLPSQRATLLTPHPRLRYSGTVPGWIAGQYARDYGTLDVAALARRAGAELILDRCVAIDPDACTVETGHGATVAFDIASIDTGGIGKAGRVLGHDDRLLDVRPIDAFVDRLDAYPDARRVCVIGGGAGGVELAFALRNRFGAKPGQDVALVAGEGGLLSEMAKAVRQSVAAELSAQGIAVHDGNASIRSGNLCVGSKNLEPVDLIVAAIGSGAPDWPADGGLACDPSGFIAVDRFQRSVSHSHIFAVGDVASRHDRIVPHSGVHAVFAGPALATNLRAAANGETPRESYTPRWNNLYLMSTGRGEAIASYGPFTAKGRWVSRLKHWIDNRWLSKYARLAKGV